MKKKLEAIFFDIDDTIYSATEFTAIARESSLKAMIECGLDISFEDGMRELEEVLKEFPENYEHHFDELLKRIPSSKIRRNKWLIISAGVVAYHRAKQKYLTAYEDVVFVLRELANKNIKLGVITSGIPIKQAEKLIRFGLHRYISENGFIIAEECGYTKNNPKIYILSCKQLNVNPSHSIYIGSHPVLDIEPPLKAGLITILNKRNPKYFDINSPSPPHYIIHNFWDLQEIINRDFII